jgi:GNAT superfamily N-acetyltransferase
MVALRADSITTHPHLGPWVAALHVLPAYRGRGIGHRLIRAAEAEAAQLGIPYLFAGSGQAAALFERLGWAVLEWTTYHGVDLAILGRDLAASGNGRNG